MAYGMTALSLASCLLAFVLLVALVSIRRKNTAIANLLKRKSDQLEVSEEELRLLATTFDSHEPILITDKDLTIRRVNPAFTRATGFERLDLVGTKASMFSLEDRYLPWHEIHHALEEDGQFSGEVMCRKKNGQCIPMYQRLTAVTDRHRGTTHYVAVYSDITEQKRTQEKINKLAFFDSLTGLPNRRKILDSLDRELAHAQRYETAGALFFMDIDNFKDINDTLGHDHGDCLLVELGRRLTDNVRKSDTVSRLGGDEFLILLPGDTSNEEDTIEHASRICEKILALSEVPYIIAGQKHYVSLSIGITIFPSNASSPLELLKQADTALYKAKGGGKNSACFFHPEMQRVAENRLAMERDLREALQRDEFMLRFQPQVDGGGVIRGAEALIRWTRPGIGAVAPEQFIPVAEDCGLIVPIGNWVLQESCEQMSKWLQQGLALDHVSVNVSPRQFRDADFVARVARVLSETQLPARHLMLELTESVVVENLDDAKSKMDALNALGVRSSMDDFGTGYSSLSYLSELPFYELKIDQRFVRSLFVDRKNSVIATTIIAMAKSLHLRVLAEGVESEEQLEFLRRHDCTNYQGYYFSQPVSACELERLMAQAGNEYHHGPPNLSVM
ncbi:GGDEF and EAL domain-containing protein [Halieaceae bacterium IMCC14734]|uniref:GGDEF and EAL domain-containing protein n=1 Tax=Candidatus Litorirhabdus singularis TaxID=2518993 RepID=A0ABT3TJ97_9GAMM|nr:GGDEF and EAL domain-containing protein [Candidatus Litorirhabdus singularis]MCX2982391.1 GGDEF and EAL domain-containing protein [Candidatus Litorirhabdus singularis]